MGCAASASDGGSASANRSMHEMKPSKHSDAKKNQVVPIQDHSTSLSVDDRFGRMSVASLDVASTSRSVCDIFTMTDARKKVRVSIAALSRDVHKSSRALIETDVAASTHSMMNSARKARRMSSVDSESSSLRKDLSLGRGKLLAKMPAPSPVDINAMSLKTLLCDATLGKSFARFAMHRGGFASESATRLGAYRPSLFLRNDVIVNNGKMTTTATISPHEVELVASFVADLGRLRSLEGAWESCARSRRSSDVELRAASGTLRDLEWNGDAVDGVRGMSLVGTGASALQPAAFAESLGRWYFGVRGLLTKLVPVECHPDPQPKLARAFSKAEQFLLTGVSQKLLQDFKKSVSLHSDTQEVPQEFAERKTVVVIGAGICGLSVCHELSAASDTFRVILIDKKDYFEFTPMIVRQLNGISARADLPFHVPLQQLLHGTEFLCGKVTSVTPHTVEVNYQKVPFDYLVVATGARARSMLKPQCVSASHRVATISAQAQAGTVSSLLVVGSGPSAVEYAAVAKSARPALEVTLCCDAMRLLPRVKEGQMVHDEIVSRLTELGVHVKLHAKLVGSGNSEGTFAIANSSERVTADKVVWCTGTVPNTAFLRPTFGHILDPIGRVKVVRTMQVAGYKHVFAGGDVCMRYTFEEKTVTTALSHAAAIARNIQRVEKGVKPVDHQEIRGLFEAVIDFGGKPGLKVTGNTFEPADTIAFKTKLFECTVKAWEKPKSSSDSCSLQDAGTNSMSLELDIDEASK